MKGIIIHGNPMWGDNAGATYCELINEASYNLTQYAPKTIISSLEGEPSETSKTVCSKNDTYDFETGALIALMKMCGLEKSAKAYTEIFDDTAMIFCGGRQNGKQYTALVNLFKKLPQDKIEAAYKEVYNTELPVWKKEFLNQMYGIYRESMKKEELPGTLDINGATYRKCDEKGRVVWMTDEFTFKPASKRKKMWDYILKEGRTPVYVERKDIHDFLEECQIAGIKWQSGKMPLEAEPFDMIEGNDGIYFFVMTSRVPNGFRHVMTWWTKAYDEDERKAINYLPPMRWDLFEKGRLVVKVSKENYAEFCSRVLSHFDKVGVNAFNHDCKFGYFMFNKDTDYAERILASDRGDIKEINGHKVVDWEDVR